MKIVKKGVCLLLALLMLIAVVPETAMPVLAAGTVESGVCGDNLTWEIDTDGVLTISGEGSMQDYNAWSTLPPWKAFSSVVIGEGVTSVGRYAFGNCTELTSVKLAGSVTSIGSEAFSGCTALKSIKIPEGVTSLGSYAFSGCTALTSIKLPDSVISMQSSVFQGCTALKSAVLPEGIFKLPWGLFYDCSALSSVEIPESITYIDTCAFYGCKSLTSIVLPEGVSVVEDSAFSDCTALTTVSVPKTVTYIAPNAFYNCSSLKKIKVDADNACYAFEDGVIYNREKTNALFSCPKGVPDSLTLPKTVETINERAFRNCSDLTSIKIPESVEYIGYYAFEGCTGLTSVKIPASVTFIGDYAFLDCSALKKISVDADNENYTSKDGIVYTKDLTGMICCPAGKTGTVTLPETVSSIQREAFAGCTKLTSVTIPESVRSIGAYAFRDCKKLTSVTIPDTVSMLEHGTFSGCSSLTSVKLPKGLTQISDILFMDCTSLKSVTIPENVEYINDRAFRNCSSLTSITIPAKVRSVIAGAFLGCSKLAKIKVDKENNMYTAVDGILYDIGKTRVIFCPAAKSGSVELPGSVTAIGWDAFYNCSNLTSVTIPEGVTEIGFCAFGHCSSLKSVSIPNTVTRIAYGAFRYCTNLGSVQLSDNVKSIDFVTFEDCGSLEKITIPESVSYIGNNAFKAAGLEKIVFEGSAPGCDGWPFRDVKATAYYPEENDTWTKTAKNTLNTGAKLTWKSYASGETPWVTELKIKTEPKTVYTELGEKAKFTVKAEGDGLTYQWYYKDVDGTKYKKCSGTKATYSLEMTEARKDRKLYCKITDEYGNSVKTKTVTMKMAASIKTQPKTQYVQLGEKAKFTVKAVGDDLKYQWYYKSAGSSKYKKASCTKATYSITMTEDRKDRKFYCVVTDKKGNEVKSKTVTMKLAVSIETEPKSVKTSIGKKAKFTVKAVGDGLTYQWYYKDTDGKKYKKASGTKATYSIELTKARNGRKFYCVVTDKYGNTVKTKTVSMKKK